MLETDAYRYDDDPANDPEREDVSPRSPPLKPFVPRPLSPCPHNDYIDDLEPLEHRNNYRGEQEISESWLPELRVHETPVMTWPDWLNATGRGKFWDGVRQAGETTLYDGILLELMDSLPPSDTVAKKRNLHRPPALGPSSGETSSLDAEDFGSRTKKRNFALIDDEENDAEPWPSKFAKLEDPFSSQIVLSQQDNNRAISKTLTTPRRLRNRCRKVLPMFFNEDGILRKVSACPDSGSEHNIMSRATAEKLGLPITTPRSEKIFHLANRDPVQSTGTVETNCFFATGTPTNARDIACIFHVFASLAVPLIMGSRFLEETETLSRHQDRLEEEPISMDRKIRVNLVDRPRKSLICKVGQFVGLATVDTGSDVDFVSDKYASARGFKIEQVLHKVMLADGTMIVTSGLARTTFSVGLVDEGKGFISRSRSIDIEFFVLAGLSSDILIGQDTIQELNIFSSHADSFITSSGQLGESDVNIIRYIGKVETAFSKAWKRIGGGSESTPGDRGVDIYRTWEFEDQRENARRELEKSGSAHKTPTEHEKERIRQYELWKAKRDSLYAIDPLSPLAWRFHAWADSHSNLCDHLFETPAEPESYTCKKEGCKAPPFKTQYLLNAHSYVHTSARPHYCPMPECPRSEGGKGFKRKNEMIRHGLIHSSPGYVCPFCPDRDHRYPRPDNLQRHVHVHHEDRDKDDPLLREVLAQRADGPNRGLRRRAMS